VIAAMAANENRRKAPRCSRCERAIHVPKGWSKDAAVRRHYWKVHPEVMRGAR
jgi:hypothetical protein